MFAPSAPPLALPPQSEHRGRTQTANKTGIRRVSTHSRLQQKKFPDTPRPPPPPFFFHKLLSLFILLSGSFLPSFHFIPLCPRVCFLPWPPHWSRDFFTRRAAV